MRKRLLDFLVCPDCRTGFEMLVFDADGDETDSGILYCANGHFFPVAGGIPRMLPSSFRDHWPAIAGIGPEPLPEPLRSFVEHGDANAITRHYDTRTRANFSNEWDNHDIGGKTWSMELSGRVRWFFLEPIRIPAKYLNGKVMLDAGCGNGSQSVAYTEFGLEVIALDLSTGLEKGYAFRKIFPKAKPENVHFVQADLQRPPLAADSFDIIHSAGVLHHTPNTENTFRALRPLLKADGTFYVWLYNFEKIVTPVVNSIRAITTRIPAPVFARIADLTSIPFIGFCWTVDKLGIRKYETRDRREAALAVHDIFGAPYANYHDFEEISGWFESVGIDEVWPCNESRRGFGICGRMNKSDKGD